MKKQQNHSIKAWALQAILSVALLSISAVLLASSFNSPQQINNGRRGDDNTATPIKHLISIVGENRQFGHLFATSVPRAGETVNNLLSEEIINCDGTPGANYS